MSTKLLYSLSDDNPNLQKQIGCMNGFLHLFDRHHFTNRRLPPGESRQQGKDDNPTSKRTKEKHKKVAKELQKNEEESSRASFSSSVGSTILSSLEYDSAAKSGESRFSATTFTEVSSHDCRVNQIQPRSNLSQNMRHRSHKNQVVFKDSTTQNCASPIKTVKREQQMGRHIQTKTHIDSPRLLLQSSKLDSSPRRAALNESFRSISSNQSAPATPLRKKKDAPRLSYDGTETRETLISGLKLGDLPRLSLDSRQRTINKCKVESKKDSLLRDLRGEEPGSYRSPSNIVAKLMGLEALPDCTPTNKSQLEPDGSSICGTLDSLSRSSRRIEESKVIRVLDSPRNNFRDSTTPRLNKAELTVKPKPKPPATVSIEHQEVNPEPQNHSLSLYGEMEKRLADIDFRKSGKDLRALKQILDTMHKGKMMGTKKKSQSSSCANSQTSTSSTSSCIISHRQGPQKANQKKSQAACPLPHTSKGSRHLEDIKSKPAIKAASPITRDVPLPGLHRLRVAHSVDTIQESVAKRTRDLTPEVYLLKDPGCQAHCANRRDSGSGIPRSIKTSKAPQHMTKVNFTNSPKISESVSTNIYRRNSLLENHRHTSATTLDSSTKQHSQHAMGPRSQNKKLGRKSTILQENDCQSSEFSTESACLSQRGNANSLLSEMKSSLASQTGIVNTSSYQSGMKYETLWEAGDNKSQGVPSDESFTELTIAIREQPSPVSVLDANFYGDESPSPVKKKPTAFRDDENTAIPTNAEWKDIDLNDLPHSIRPSFSNGRDHQKLEKFKQSAQTFWQLNHNQNGNIEFAIPLHEEVNPEKAYVVELLSVSRFLDDLNITEAIHRVHQSKEAINPSVFFVLEQTKGSRFLSDNESSSRSNLLTKTNNRHMRRLIFDLVNETLSEKLSSTGFGSKPHPVLSSLSRFRTGKQLLQEMFKEIDQLHTNNLHQSLDDEDDFLTTIIGKDLTHTSANWTDASSEKSGLVLDIERLIFKDLIVELVNDESAHLQAQK